MPKIQGWRIGQAANLAHERVLWDRVDTESKGETMSEESFTELWREHTARYIAILNDFEQEFGGVDDEDWTDMPRPKRAIPIKLDFGEEIIDTTNN